MAIGFLVFISFSAIVGFRFVLGVFHLRCVAAAAAERFRVVLLIDCWILNVTWK